MSETEQKQENMTRLLEFTNRKKKKNLQRCLTKSMIISQTNS